MKILVCCSHVYVVYDVPSMYILVVAALIPTEEHLQSINVIEFPPPQISFSLFGPQTPSIQIPAQAILETRKGSKYI